MEQLIPNSARAMLVENAAAQLRACNDLSGRYGLLLSEPEIRELALRQVESLQNTGRLEFGTDLFQKLVYAFCDSPYLTPENYAESLGELLESFYYFKNESLERFSDDELIELMKQHFDGKCQGSLEYLSGTTLEELCRRERFGEGDGHRF